MTLQTRSLETVKPRRSWHNRGRAAHQRRVRRTKGAGLSPSDRLYDRCPHFFGKFGSFLISRICWMCLSAWVEISSIHCQQSIFSP